MNTYGSYECKCPVGYVLREDRRMCRGESSCSRSSKPGSSNSICEGRCPSKLPLVGEGWELGNINSPWTIRGLSLPRFPQNCSWKHRQAKSRTALQILYYVSLCIACSQHASISTRCGNIKKKTFPHIQKTQYEEIEADINKFS